MNIAEIRLHFQINVKFYNSQVSLYFVVCHYSQVTFKQVNLYNKYFKITVVLLKTTDIYSQTFVLTMLNFGYIEI